MIPITRADDDLFGTAVMAARLGRAGPLIEHVRQRYNEEWDDPTAGLPFALTMFALLQSGGEELHEQFNFTDIVETLSDLLYHEPGHWLGRYLRIHVRTMLPTDGEYQNYMVAERVRAADWSLRPRRCRARRSDSLRSAASCAPRSSGTTASLTCPSGNWSA
jgi:hypothetical protein